MTTDIRSNTQSENFAFLTKLKEEYRDHLVLPYEKERLFNPFVNKKDHDAKYGAWKLRVNKMNKQEYAMFCKKLIEINDKIDAFLKSIKRDTVKH